LTKIDFSKYVESLATHLFHIYYKTSIHIDIEINVKDVSFNINTAIPCALLINELVSNSLKYAFPKKRRGKIGIILESQNTTPHLKTDLIPYKLVVSDNGIGLPENLDFRAVESLGFKLVNALVKQLNGSIRLTRTKKTVFTITFIASSISK